MSDCSDYATGGKNLNIFCTCGRKFDICLGKVALGRNFGRVWKTALRGNFYNVRRAAWGRGVRNFEVNTARIT